MQMPLYTVLIRCHATPPVGSCWQRLRSAPSPAAAADSPAFVLCKLCEPPQSPWPPAVLAPSQAPVYYVSSDPDKRPATGRKRAVLQYIFLVSLLECCKMAYLG